MSACIRDLQQHLTDRIIPKGRYAPWVGRSPWVRSHPTHRLAGFRSVCIGHARVRSDPKGIMTYGGHADRGFHHAGYQAWYATNSLTYSTWLVSSLKMGKLDSSLADQRDTVPFPKVSHPTLIGHHFPCFERGNRGGDERCQGSAKPSVRNSPSWQEDR